MNLKGNYMIPHEIVQLFHFDLLAGYMSALIIFLALNIVVFSTRYMQGDTSYGRYFFRLGLLTLSLLVMVSADHLIIFLLGWLSTNFLLCKLMTHKTSWRAARHSGYLALRNFLVGFLFIGTAFTIFYIEAGTLSIQSICQMPQDQSPLMIVSLFCLLVAAMTQSAIWPFHRWLLSSLNSPTPVSAMMHAGIVNGGGFLLLRFGQLFGDAPMLLQLTFIIGIVTCIIGTTWKLIQHDIKRTLAASTVGQMGFMFAQFGLGLYAATLAHIMLHGLYKSFLFLNTGNSVNEKRYKKTYDMSISQIAGSLFCAFTTLLIFSFIQGHALLPNNTLLIPQLIVAIVGFQLGAELLKPNWKIKELGVLLLIGSFVATYYGLLLLTIENFIGSSVGIEAQPLSPVYIIGIFALLISWSLVMFGKSKAFNFTSNKTIDKAYVGLLNASQPHPKSITAIRNHYKYH